ncbi:hypothetical protein QCM80_44885 [Bradyrhizobium sp. SSUT112]|uniref:hypothetical protein n=1 Tax=Bradyrhizobium sp. SSUT112 TaxID=3040604 RepID=UPI0024478222|nr:hypothetical protein [Bradyrhizobium sp. SSUT112]MDH2357616.1 hypothetical protein [Bradyrhizobium sp. SSUT112]
MLESAMTSDELEKISDATEEWRHHLTDRLFRAHDEAVRYEIENVGTIVEDMDSESPLKEHIDTIRKLSKRVDLVSQSISKAVETVKRR